MRSPRILTRHAMLAAAMSAKDGRITFPEVLDAVQVVSQHGTDLDRAAIRAFANRILLMSIPSECNCTFAGRDLHDYLIERGQMMEAAE